MTEIQTKIRALIAEHEEQVKVHSTTSNAGSYHRGQIRKLSQASVFLKDYETAAARYAETVAEQEDQP